MADINISKFTTQVVRVGSTPSSPGFAVDEGQDPVNPSGTNNYVPYSGATQNVDLGEFGLDTGFVNLDTTPTNTPTTQGTMYWDDSRSTAALIMNGTLQHIGQDTFFYVKNASGSSIAKGTAVRFDGTDGASGHLLIAPFLANGTYPSNYFMGVTAETIGNGGFGQVMHFGELSGINTSGYTAGALLYASTTIAGGFQTTAPVAPNNIVLIAAAINSKNNGEILVRPTYGSNINQDEGVKIVSPTTGQLLQLQSNGLWENKTKAQVLGGTSTQFVKGDGSLDSTTYQSTADKGQPNGYASLDSNGKVPLTQINDALIGNVNYQGLWNASTNTPTLVNPPSSGTKGYYYIVTTAGTFAGISFEVGDWIISNGTAWQKVDNTDAVSSVFGRTGNVVAANGDYTTAQVTESGNLYFTNARSRQAISLTTSGTSGAATYDNSTGVFNIPQYQSVLTNPVTGTGSAGQVAYWSSGSAITGESNLFWDAANDRLGIGTAIPSARLHVANAAGGVVAFLQSTATNGESSLNLEGRNSSGTVRSSVFKYDNSDLIRIGTSSPIDFRFETNDIERMRITSGGRVLIGTPPPAESTFALDVNGTGRFSSNVTGEGFYLPTASVNGSRDLAAGENSSTGNSAHVRMFLQNSATSFILRKNGTGFTTSGINYAGAAAMYDDGPQGINIGSTNVSGGLRLFAGNTLACTIEPSGAANFLSSVTATSIIRSGGTSSQFLKADGSVDSTTYVPTSRTITINGTTQDLSANRTFNVGTVTGTGTSGQVAYFNGTTSITSETSLFWDATNDRLGIGTASPSTKLHVESPSGTDTVARFSRGPSNAGDIMFGLGDYGGGYQSRIGALQLAFEVNRANGAGLDTGTTAMFIKSNGNVGIGTTNPSDKLSVTDASTYTFNIGAAAGGAGAVLYVFGGAALTFSTNGSSNQRMGITSGGNVMIGTGSANSKLQVAGSIALPHVTKSANYTLDATDYTVGFDCASSRTANLPDATTCAGRIYVIYQYNTNNGARYVTLDGNGSQTIDGVTTYSLQYQENFSSLMIQSTGSNWVVISDKVYPAPV